MLLRYTSRWTLHLAVAMTIVCFAAPSFAATYYISSSLGNDSWAGTLPEPNGQGNGPKRSVGTALALVKVASPGDQILLRRGDVWTGAMGSIDTGVGSPSNWIVVGAYGTGALPKITANSGNYIIQVRGNNTIGSVPQYVRFSDLDFECTNPDRDLNPVGVNVIETYRTYTPHHITFDNINVNGCFMGVVVQFSDYVMFENSLVKENYGGGGHSQGIFIHDANYFTLRNSELDTNGKPGIGFDHNIYISQSANVLLEGNTIHGQFSGIKIRKGGPVTITGNTIYDQEFSSITAGADAEKTLSDITITGNVLYGSARGINLKSQSAGDSTIDGAIVANNVIYGHSQYGIRVGATDFFNASIIHNTIVPNGKQGVIFEDRIYRNVVVSNNIFSGTATMGMFYVSNAGDLQDIDLDSNLYFTNGMVINAGTTEYSSLDAFRSDHSEESRGIEADPGFANASAMNYSLAGGSSAIDAGQATFLTVDFSGTFRPQGVAPDIGAYEMGSGSQPARPAPPILLRGGWVSSASSE